MSRIRDGVADFPSYSLRERVADGLVEGPLRGAAARAFDDVAMEPVVRFGRPSREVVIETETFGFPRMCSSLRLKSVLECIRIRSPS